MKKLCTLLLALLVMGSRSVCAMEFDNVVPITQGDLDSNVPFSLASNTRYVVTEDLQAPCNEDGTPRVSEGGQLFVASFTSNTELDFAGHTLFVPTNVDIEGLSTVTGILIADNSSNVVVKNGTMRAAERECDVEASESEIAAVAQETNARTLAINLRNNTENITIEDMTFEGFNFGIATDDSEDAQVNSVNNNLAVRRSIFTMPEGGEAIQLTSILTGVFEELSFFNGLNGLFLLNNSNNIRVSRSSFTGQTNSAIAMLSINDPEEGFFFARPAENLIVEHSTFSQVGNVLRLLGVKNTLVSHVTASGSQTGAPFDALIRAERANSDSPELHGLQIADSTFDGVEDLVSIIQLGDTTVDNDASVVSITNSTFANPHAAGYYSDILSAQVHGLSIENCVFDSTGYARDEQGCPLIENGCPVKSSNLQFGANPVEGVEDALVTDVLVRDSVLTGPAQVGVYSDTGAHGDMNRRITLDNLSITALEAGVIFNNTSSSSILNSRIKDVRGSEFANGIGVLLNGATPCNENALSNANEVCGNSVSSNQNGIVVDHATRGNVVTGNKVYANDFCQISSGSCATVCDNIVDGCPGPCCLQETECMGGKLLEHNFARKLYGRARKR